MDDSNRTKRNKNQEQPKQPCKTTTNKLNQIKLKPGSGPFTPKQIGLIQQLSKATHRYDSQTHE